jgi:hypothetical protein
MLAVVLHLAVACSGGGSDPPSTLMDGSPSREPSVELEGASGSAVLTKVRVVDIGAVEPGSLSSDCLRGPAQDAAEPVRLVERIGVASETVTVQAGDGLHGCDNAPGPREDERRWCGTAFGLLHGGRLRDPRLGLGCRTAEGDLIGLAWVEPHARARYVVVRQPGYAEVYETAGGLAVRIATTSGIDVASSSAAFDVSEHDSGGRLLREYRLEAAVAG